MAGRPGGVRWMGLPVMSPGDLCRKLNDLVAGRIPTAKKRSGQRAGGGSGDENEEGRSEG
jgi:hypothetical protein